MENKIELTDPKVFSLPDKDEKKIDSFDNIHLPQYSKIPPILKKVLDIAGLRHSQISSLNGFYSRDLSDRWIMRATIDLRQIKDTIQSVTSEVAGLTFIYATPEF